MAHHEDRVGTGAKRLQLRTLRADVHGAPAVLVDDDGGHALGDQVGGGATATVRRLQTLSAVGMKVDEAGRHHLAPGVDDPLGCGVGQVAHGRDHPVPDADIRVDPGVAGAIQDLGSGDEHVERSGLLSLCGRGGREQREQKNANQQATHVFLDFSHV